jgi:hypothetical protein
MPTKTERLKVVWLRMPLSVVARLDRQAAQLHRETGKRATRGHLIRTLLARGLDSSGKRGRYGKA